MKSGIKALEENNIWKDSYRLQVDYTIKHRSVGSIERYKVRLVKDIDKKKGLAT